MRDVGPTTQMDPEQLRSLLERERPTLQMRALPPAEARLRLVIATLALAFAIVVTVLTLL